MYQKPYPNDLTQTFYPNRNQTLQGPPMDGSAPCNETCSGRRPQVIESIDDLDRSVRCNRELIEELLNRLAPVMLARPNQCGADGPSVSLCPIAESIKSQATALNIGSDILRHILDSLEV